MSKKMTTQQKMNYRGIEFISPILGSQMGCTFEEHQQQKDYGTDFTVQLFEKGAFTGLIIDGQLKSGNSWIKHETDKFFVMYVSKCDAETWMASNTPFILIWYSPSQEKAYWLNIRKYLRLNYRGRGVRVEIPKSNVLSKDSLRDFLELTRNEYSGLPATESMLYKPLYDFLYGDFNKKDENDLRIIQNEYETKSQKLKTTNFQAYYSSKIEFALSQRRLYSLTIAIANLEHLGFETTKALPKRLIYKRFYWLAIMNYENHNLQSAYTFLTKIPTQDRDNRHLLLSALIEDARVEVGKAQRDYSRFMLTVKKKDKYLKGIVSLLAGVMLRRNDDYRKAAKYFNRAMASFRRHNFYEAIVKANLGVLYFLQEDFQKSSQSFEKAISLFHAYGDRYAEAEMLMNLSYVKDEESASKETIGVSSGFDIRRRSAYLQPKNDHLVPVFHRLYGYEQYIDEAFEATAKTYTMRHSNNIFEGDREFRYAERMSEYLGSFVMAKVAQIQNAKCLFNVGMQTGDKSLPKTALYSFIITANETGIEGVYNQSLDSLSPTDIAEALKWCLSIKGDRYAELGRLEFLRIFAAVIPDGFISKVVALCLRYEKRGYAFNNHFDFGRKAVATLDALSYRLNRQQKETIVNLALKDLGKNEWFVVDAKLTMLADMPFDQLNKSNLNKIFNTLNDEIVGKIRTRDPWMVYRIWEKIAAVSNKKLKHQIYSKLSSEFLTKKQDKQKGKSKTPDVNVSIGLYMSRNTFRGMPTNEETSHLVNHIRTMLREERKRATLNSYGIGNFNHLDCLALLFSSLSEDLRDKVINSILSYVSSKNILPLKRSAGIRTLLSFAPNKLSKVQKSKLYKIMRTILNGQDTSEKQEPNYYFDSSVLKGYALFCLVKFGYDRIEWMITVAQTLGIRSTNNSLKIVIRCLGELSKRAMNRESKVVVTTILLQHLTSENIHAVSISLRTLADSSRTFPSFQYSILKSAISLHSNSPNYQIRQSVAYACKHLKSLKSSDRSFYQSVLMCLRKDINYDVRSEAA
jgi:tetratricopeptide (TPR) repeat protein